MSSSATGAPEATVETMHAVDARGSGGSSRMVPPDRRPAAAWWKIGTGAGVLAAEAAGGYLRPALGELLAAVDVIVPVMVALILLTAILRGSNETYERVFRLLRWIANRPEPPAPLGHDPTTVARRSCQTLRRQGRPPR